MAKDRTGYVGKDKNGKWFARVTITDDTCRRRNIAKRAKDKRDAKTVLKGILSDLDAEGSQSVDLARLTFNDLANHISNEGTRRQVRERVVREFLNEESGTGNKELTSKYIYTVETLANGQRLVLTRPAYLNKVFDFVIRVEGVNFGEGKGRRRDNPTLMDIVQDLETKREANSTLYKQLFESIQQTFECHNVSPETYSNMNFQVGYPVELILKVIKWFFIEQDITYWNFSGRSMLMSKVPIPE